MSDRKSKQSSSLLNFAIGAGIVVCLPFVLFLGNGLAGSLWGAVNVWNTTWNVPPDADLAGYYQVSKGDYDELSKHDGSVSDQSGFKLYPDRLLEVIDLPSFDGFGKPGSCHYNGTGHWNVDPTGFDKTLNLAIDKVTESRKGDFPSCGATALGTFALLGHSRPYRFWYYIGDPDSDEGLRYRLVNNR